MEQMESVNSVANKRMVRVCVCQGRSSTVRPRNSKKEHSVHVNCAQRALYETLVFYRHQPVWNASVVVLEKGLVKVHVPGLNWTYASVEWEWGRDFEWECRKWYVRACMCSHVRLCVGHGAVGEGEVPRNSLDHWIHGCLLSQECAIESLCEWTLDQKCVLTL
jgi:hypothetical protein